jgi:hypothetical protein
MPLACPRRPVGASLSARRFLEKRRHLMQAWADYCEPGEDTVDNVVPLRA